MNLTIQYETDVQRENIINEKTSDGLYFIGEQINFDDKFLVFSPNPLVIEKRIVYTEVPKEEFDLLKEENTLLKAQNQTLTDRTDFHEDLIAEMAMLVYS
ncbi:hypothetical protein F7731_08700 [Cytobacillus depressus]|uniref:Uncharacterized protein n=1 Tax=Cytobacillus depressus TaxID=1602942 RepID=A0A6L3V894_9BACI|nr:hypothetical protein [Cytobacillus depressus]KAB2337662.1 hypothetical protein F7731_08700 [Cytobacillus depressus]